MIDKDFELNAERQNLKKLTVEDIPEGYYFAAVDKDGWAFAYERMPVLLPNTYDVDYNLGHGPPVTIGHGYDATDWENSLVSRKPAELPQPKKLTADDIPKGYNYAAVDGDGTAYAYFDCPFIGLNLSDWTVNGRNYERIGEFDASDWENSLVSRKPAELPQPKKLTAENIPDGYYYAAVDPNGHAYAYKKTPIVLSNRMWSRFGGDTDKAVIIGVNFDASNWQNSLVSRIPAERPTENKAAVKDQENKPSFLEIDPNFLEAMAWRMTSNKGKYPPNNWQRPHDLLLDVDAIYRHINDIKRQLEGGKSLTGESIQKHCAAIGCNAMFLFFHTQEDQWTRAQRSRQSNASQI